MTGSSSVFKPCTIGLTGGIACGKSTVASMFESLGVSIVDADIISRQVVEPGKEAFFEIVSAFGCDIVTKDGLLDRRKLRNIVFTDDCALKTLNEIVHPRVHQKLADDINAAQGCYVIAAVPLLIEHGLMSMFDRILVADCKESLQIKRICSRDGSDESIARGILQKQVSRDTRLSHADDIISTDNVSYDEVLKKVKELDTQYRALALCKHK